MEPPMMGEHAIVIAQVNDIAIHSSHFFDLAYYLEQDTDRKVHTCRVGPESVEGTPAPGDRYVADFMMRQLTGVRRA